MASASGQLDPKLSAVAATGADGPRPDGPRHVALIMDGNGRWAKARGLPRTLGHRAGVSALKRTVEAAPDLGIQCLTVFGFSTENWRRPVQEVSELMSLVRLYVQSDLDRLEREGVRMRILGRAHGIARRHRRDRRARGNAHGRQ